MFGINHTITSLHKARLSIITAIHSDITRKSITAGAEMTDDRLSELCGLDLPSAP